MCLFIIFAVCSSLCWLTQCDAVVAAAMPRQLRVGTMFNGLEMQMWAMKDVLGDKCTHVFAVECKRTCCKFLQCALRPRHLVNDVRNAAAIVVLPPVDVLWLSPPCIDCSGMVVELDWRVRQVH